MSAFYQLEFEKAVTDLERQISDAERQSPGTVPALGGVTGPENGNGTDLEGLRTKRDKLLAEAYEKLTAWDIVRVARHPKRPQGRDYIDRIARDFCELHGDRRFGDDPAIVTGFGRIGNHKCLIVAHHKGRDTAEKLKCSFGCANPEGYRKALLKMKTAEKFGRPIVTLVDTPGAYPGIGAEQRGQAEAIAVNLREMSRIRVPIVSVVIGEGGSGGALGIAVADKVAMMRYAWYSVISPEGCAAILWKQANADTNRAAAESLKLTADDNLRLGIIDAIIDEPVGAAHRNPGGAADNLAAWVTTELDSLTKKSGDELVKARFDRFRNIGVFEELAPPPEVEELPTEEPA